MRKARVINALTKGVLDPRLQERIDLAHYYTSVRVGQNVVFRPQGGFRIRPGTRLSAQTRLRHMIEPVLLAANMITAPNGGTAANLLDADARFAPAAIDTGRTSATTGATDPPVTLTSPAVAVYTTVTTTTTGGIGGPVTTTTPTIDPPSVVPSKFTTGAVGASPFVLFEIDLGSAQTVTFVDLLNFSCASGSYDNAVAVEYFDGASWVSVPGTDRTSLPPRSNLRTTARTRRFGGHPGWNMAAQHWRIAVYGAIGAGAVTVSGVKLWREIQRLSPVRIIPFSRSLGSSYELVLSDRNVDVWDGWEWMAAIPVPIAAEDVRGTSPRAADDTVFLWHEDYWTPRLMIQGAPDEWQSDWVPFVQVPQLSSGSAYSGNQDEVQQIVFPPLAAGDKILLWLEEVATAPVTFSTAGALPAAIAAAISAVTGVAGVTASLVGSPVVVQVAFSGASGGRRWPKLSARVLADVARALPQTTVVQPGIAANGALFEPATGWPRCGLVHQGRLIVGGPRAAPRTLCFSVLDNLWCFQPTWTPVLATDAIEVSLDSDQAETIQDVFMGRHLQVFTEAGEWWSDNRTWDASATTNMILGSRYGLEAKIPVTFAEDATLFVGQVDIDAEKGDGQVLRAMTYSDVAQNYQAEPLNLLGPHLLNTVVSVAFRKARSINWGGTVFVVNSDGTLGLMTLLRSQEVLAMSAGIYAQGAVRDCAVDIAGRPFMVIERAGELWLERSDDACMLDGSVQVEGAGITSVATPHLVAGAEAWAIIDGDIYGPLAVAGGAVALPVATVAAAEVGVRIVPLVTTNPLREKLQEGQPFRLPARIYEVELSLIGTSNVRVSANGGPLRDVPLQFADGGQPLADRGGEERINDDMDTPELSRLFTGRATLEGLVGISKHPSVTITQARPGPLEVRAIRIEAASV